MTKRVVTEKSWMERYGINLATLGAVIVSGAGFYFTTISKLEEHSKALVKLEAASNAGDKAREKVRDDFLANSLKTAEGISALNTETKVQNVQLIAINQALEKISRTLETVTVQRR